MRGTRGQAVVACLAGLAAAIVLAVSWPSSAQTENRLLARVRQEQTAYLATLQELVAIESGSRDTEGLERAAALVAARLRAIGGEVEIVPAPADMARLEDTPTQPGKSVVARFRGTGKGRVLLLSHMDTVYVRGSAAKQPFRIEGNRAYGLGISDDKSGVALAIHAVAVLNAIDARDYGLVTVLVNGDEEISSPGSRGLITRLGAEHDAVFSVEGSDVSDSLRLATSGNGAALLRVTGRSAHAGSAPGDGRNALYELSHQILQMRDLSDPQTGATLNWTVARAGSARNIIPAAAEATADARVLRVRDWDVLEARLRERIKKRLIPDTHVSVVLERRRPPLEPTAASRAMAAHAAKVYQSIGRRLRVLDRSEGGGTDAAFAALKTKAPVVEGFGPIGAGAHSDERESIDLRSVEPRMYLLARMILDVGARKIAGGGAEKADRAE
jgi:glutamate carboxypeptidase